MKIEKIFAATEEDIEAKKFNILVPICIGNRFFLEGVTPTDNIKEYINWSLNHTKEKIIILVVDKIQISNWVVRNSNMSLETNMRRLMRTGERIEKNILDTIKKLPKSLRERIKVARWEECCKKDPFCEKVTEIIHREFKTNIKFKEKVLEAVKKSITDRTFDEKGYLTLCNYVLDEFSLAYHGIDLDGVKYRLYIYPETDKVLELIENIKSGIIFPELSNKLDKQKIAVALLR